MKRSLIAIVLAVSAIVAACGDGGSAPPVTEASATETTATETTEAAAVSPATTTQAPATTAANGDEVAPSGVDGPQAPDFEFQLDDGSTFVLSEEAMPVYMVFWAEW